MKDRPSPTRAPTSPPRVGFDYDPHGTGATVLRGGFGIYYSQVVDNSEANYALTGPTGVFNYTATPGQVGFPTSIADAPLPAFPSGAIAPLRSLYIRPGRGAYLNQFFPTSTLIGYPSKLLNPYSEQWTVSLEQRLAAATVLSIDYVGTHTVHINRPLDVDPPTSFIRTAQGQTRSATAANCTRPYWVYYFQQTGGTCLTSPASADPPYSVIQSDVNDGYLHYNALDVNLRESFGDKGILLASYTWSHTTDNVDPDATSQNPNDPNQTGAAERGNALYDQRNRLVLSGYYVVSLRIQIGGVASLAGGLPYNLVIGTNNSGDTGATSDRPWPIQLQRSCAWGLCRRSTRKGPRTPAAHPSHSRPWQQHTGCGSARRRLGPPEHYGQRARRNLGGQHNRSHNQ